MLTAVRRRRRGVVSELGGSWRLLLPADRRRHLRAWMRARLLVARAHRAGLPQVCCRSTQRFTSRLYVEDDDGYNNELRTVLTLWLSLASSTLLKTQ